MIKLESVLSGKTFPLYHLETKLKPLGCSIGGNWDYDSGCFDYKLDDEDGYQFLRIPFKAVNGQLDVPGVTVEIQQPFLLSHVYEEGIDQEGNIGAVSGTFNQFAEPEDKDADFPEAYVPYGQAVLHKIEKALQ